MNNLPNNNPYANNPYNNNPYASNLNNNPYGNNPYNNPQGNRQNNPNQIDFFNDTFSPQQPNINPFATGSNFNNDFFIPPVNLNPPPFNPSPPALIPVI
jgi:hypothetical protein